MLLTAWSVAANHCKLEQLPGFHFLKCGESAAVSNHPQDDCESDACESLESGFYKTEDGKLAAMAPMLAEIIPVLFSPESIKPSAENNFASVPAPPELSPRWQFVFRTASPPRAPSFAS